MGAALMALVLTICLSSLPAQAQYYEAEESDLTNPCGALSAPLTGSFTPDPCQLTRDRRASDLSFAHNFYGGQQLIEYLDNWWETEFLPALKDLTKQLSASKVKQTLDRAMAEDASRILETRATIEKEKLEALRDKVVNDQEVISETPKQGIVAGQKLSNNLTQTIKRGITQRPAGMSSPPEKYGPALDHKSKWALYCAEFRDPKDNNGANGCYTANGEGDVRPAMVDGDIDIEGFLFKDTIDIRNSSEYKAAFALLQNLVQHKPATTIPKTAIDSSAGREQILQQQHIEAVRNIAADVVSSMMTRRSALILPDISSVAPDGNFVPTECTKDRTDTSFTAYMKALRCKENSGCYANAQWQAKYGTGLDGKACPSINKLDCLGAYQFCPGSLPPQTSDGCWLLVPGSKVRAYIAGRWVTVAMTGTWPDGSGRTCTWGGTQASSEDEFLGNPAAQDAAYYDFAALAWNSMMAAGLGSFLSGNHHGVIVTASGLLGAAHISGPGGAENFVRTGGGGSDVNGTGAGTYIRMFAGYDTPFQADTYVAVGPGNDPTVTLKSGKSIAKFIMDIRKKAGIHDTRIAKNSPSYNEIMLAMTKERFFDPEYFTKIREGKTSIMKEQASIESYISIQYQDIYQLQEQINALLAARAALKVNSDSKPSQVQSSPLKN